MRFYRSASSSRRKLGQSKLGQSTSDGVIWRFNYFSRSYATVRGCAYVASTPELYGRHEVVERAALCY